MNKMFRHIIILTLAAISALVLGGCSKKFDGVIVVESMRMSISVSVPQSDIKQFAIDEKNETKINDANILVFKDDAGVKTFSYSVEAQVIASGASSKLAFDVKPDANIKQHFVILVNYGDNISNLLGTINIGDSKESVIERASFDYDAQNALSITMWGEVPSAIYNPGIELERPSPVLLVRALAKVNFELGSRIADTYTLKTVRLYNTESRGSIVPFAGNYDFGELITLNPSVPYNSQPTDASIYTSFDADHNAVNGMYITEQAAIKGAWNPRSTCFVVNVSKLGDTGSWYRVDIVNKANAQEDILRNFVYNINIKGIKGKGYDTAEEALNSMPLNIEFDVKAWSENFIGSGGGGSVGETHNLYVSTGALENVETSTFINIKTDNPSGWKASIVSGGNWITLLTASGASNTFSKIEIKFTRNTSGKPRSGEIIVAAGNISKVIRITQQ